MSAYRPAQTLPSVSPLFLADLFLTLAQQADQAGMADTAGRLVVLAHRVMEEPIVGSS